MTAAREPAPLAPFSQDWIGGNIRGLSRFAGVLYAYVLKIDNVASALDHQVSELVEAANWEGSAARTFTAAWQKDSAAARAIGSAAGAIAQAVDQLAVTLSKLESELEDAAADARKHGVAVGANGQPPAITVEEARFGPSNASEQWSVAYYVFYEETMIAAQQARDAAATVLAKYTQAAAGDGMTLGDTIIGTDLLGDMLALPTANQPIVEARMLKVRQEESNAIRQAEQGQLTADELVNKLAAEDLALAHDEAALARNAAIETEVSKMISTSVGDLTKAVNTMMARLANIGSPGASAAAKASAAAGTATGTADGAGDASDSILSRVIDFGSDIPVIDVAAAMAGTGLATYADVKAGESLGAALPAEVTSNVLGVAAGAVVGGTAMAAIGGGIVGGAVAAGAAGVVAFGVGDFTDKLFHENWSADIHSDGVVAGVGAGIGHSVLATGDDMTSLGAHFGHTVAHLWDGIA